MNRPDQVSADRSAKVFISSTAEDLHDYRAAARDAAIAAGLLPVQMEYFAASGKRLPRDACLQKIMDVDVVVLILAHRYGWVPQEQPANDHRSITWQECEHAVTNNKEVLAFVVDDQHPWKPELKEDYRLLAAVGQGTATPELLADVQRNVQRLSDFKAWIDARGMRKKFTTPQDLGWKVAEALAEWKQERGQQDPQALAGESQAPREPVFPTDYRNWLQNQCADIDIVGLRMKESRPIKLNHVYVPLTTAAQQRGASDDVQKEPSESKSELLLNRINKHSLYVSGPPGSGKSTFCRWVAWLMCTSMMPEVETSDPKKLCERYPESLRGKLPVLIRFRDFWKYLPTDPGQELSLAQLEKSLSRWLAEKQPGDLTWSVLQLHLSKGSAVLMFDGVDEVPISTGDGAATAYPRAAMLSGLREAVATWLPTGNRLIVTSRPYGLDEVARQQLGLPEARIDDLDEPAQRELAARWFRILADDADAGARLADEMLNDIRQRAGINQLTASPMLLTAMCVIYREGKKLPQDKCDLYDRIVENVLYNRVRDPIQIEKVRNQLRVAALAMHSGQAAGKHRSSPDAEVDYQEIDDALENYRQQSSWTEQGFVGIVQSREFLLSHTGLLLPRADRQAAFLHFSIQEFLAAQRLARSTDDDLVPLFQQRGAVTEWHNTLSFLFGAIHNADTERSVHLLERLLERVHRDELGLQVVIGEALQMLLAKQIRLQAQRESAFKDLCQAAITGEVSLRERNLLARALGHLGDPRVVADLREISAYVPIPADEYAYQNGRHTIEQAFGLSIYPVTNIQYSMFIDDDGYTQRDYWSDQGWTWKTREKITEPAYWRDPSWNAPNQPVVGVSFHEAEACCKWAGGFLPSEQQWETAARGPDGLEYPWGNDWEDGICNSWDAGLRTTSPVGLFPRSRSRDFGLEDLAGNVWEWCDSWYDSDRDRRVLRGGSFVYSAPHVRSAYRVNVLPVTRNNGIGFRVARTYP